MAVQEYKFQIDRSLSITPEELCKIWNGDAECSDIAEADVELGRGIDPVALLVLGNLASGVASNALYGLIMHIFESRGKHVSIHPETADSGEVTLIISDQGAQAS